MRKEYLIVPTPKPRMSNRDRWLKPARPAVARYRNFCTECMLKKVHMPISGAHVTFVMPMSDSWSEKKKKQFDGLPHQLKRKNDWDNLGKALSDAVYGEDSMIWDIRITKIWGRMGKIIVKTQDHLA